MTEIESAVDFAEEMVLCDKIGHAVPLIEQRDAAMLERAARVAEGRVVKRGPVSAAQAQCNVLALEIARDIRQLERERDDGHARAEHARAEQSYANYVGLMRDVADERNATAETVARLERERDAALAQVAELRAALAAPGGGVGND